ncbi:MAG: hypothetical protein Q9221_002778 [Calogaya cf. arnoldii]
MTGGNLTVAELHGILSKSLHNVPDVDTFCKTLDVLPTAFVIGQKSYINKTKQVTTAKAAKKGKNTSAKSNAVPVKKAKAHSYPLRCDDNRILLVTMPQAKLINTKELQIQVQSPHAKSGVETTQYSIMKQGVFGIALQFPTIQMCSGARYKLRSHLLKYNGDDPFQLNVHDEEYEYLPGLVLPVVEVPNDGAIGLMDIVVRFFPVAGHAPLYTYRLNQTQQPNKSLLIAAAFCHKWLGKRLRTTESVSPGANSNAYLSTSCTPHCVNCPQKVEIVEVDLQRT